MKAANDNDIDHVYLIAWSKRGPTKIGVSGKIVSRLAELQPGNPYRLRVFHAWHVGIGIRSFEIEATMKARFERYRLIGEWFCLPPKFLADAIQALAREHATALNLWRPTAYQRTVRKRQLKTEMMFKAQEGIETYNHLTGAYDERLASNERVIKLRHSKMAIAMRLNRQDKKRSS